MTATTSPIPERMRAIGIPAPGGPEALVLQERPVPVPKAREILVRVAAAGVNRPDVVQRLGQYDPPPDAPDIPGLEIAGTVVARGEGATRFNVGDRICALVPGGGYAEFCAVHEDNALPVPGDLTDIEAGAIPETFFTVWTNVFERGRLQPGETLLVHGGSSGIGTTAIMLAKAFGARVVATAGSDEKCEACRRLGADLAVNYRTQDFVAETHTLTGGKGANVILDMVGGDYAARNYEAAALDARIVQIALLGGAQATVNLHRIMMKRLTHTGSTLRGRSVEEKAGIARALEAAVWPHLAAGRCRPEIYKTFPLAEAAESHRLMESSAHIGKIVLLTD